MSDYPIHNKPEEHIDDIDELTAHHEYVVSETEVRMMLEEFGRPPTMPRRIA